MKGEFDKVKMMQWAELIRQANDSPLDRETWCKENGVSSSSFYYWQRRIRKFALNQMLAPTDQQALLPDTAQESTSAHEDCYEIALPSLMNSPSHPKDASTPTKGTISIRYGDFSIDVEEGFSAEALSSVLKVLNHV
ncbi:MAG: hypothetical protein E7307_02010 [Butyrivibrio sp.]|nr:hypothetical protein [Butyrivibrio sp.]